MSTGAAFVAGVAVGSAAWFAASFAYVVRLDRRRRRPEPPP